MTFLNFEPAPFFRISTKVDFRSLRCKLLPIGALCHGISNFIKSQLRLHCEKESTEVRLFCFLIQLVGIQMPDNCISIKGGYTLVLKYYLIALQYQQMVFKTIPRLRYEIVVPLIHIVGIKSVLWRFAKCQLFVLIYFQNQLINATPERKT